MRHRALVSLGLLVFTVVTACAPKRGASTTPAADDRVAGDRVAGDRADAEPTTEPAGTFVLAVSEHDGTVAAGPFPPDHTPAPVVETHYRIEPAAQGYEAVIARGDDVRRAAVPTATVDAFVTRARGLCTDGPSPHADPWISLEGPETTRAFGGIALQTDDCRTRFADLHRDLRAAIERAVDGRAR